MKDDKVRPEFYGTDNIYKKKKTSNSELIWSN